MRHVRFLGGPCDGLDTSVDPRDLIACVRVALIDGCAVMHTATTTAETLAAGRGLWVDYYRWPTDGPGAEYRHERPPRPQARAGQIYEQPRVTL